MKIAEDFDNELSGFEQQLAQQLERYKPDTIFVQDLKERLVSSQVFKRRSEIGAIVVSSLGLLFIATLAFSLGQLLHPTKKAISR
jgi:hypothetical protein